MNDKKQKVLTSIHNFCMQRGCALCWIAAEGNAYDPKMMALCKHEIVRKASASLKEDP